MSKESKRIGKQLIESEEKYKLILDNANDLITIINENLEYEYINQPAYFDLLGYTEEDISGSSPITRLLPEDVKIANKMLRDGFKYGEGKNEMRLIHKDGHYVWFDHKGKTFIDTDGNQKILVISRDITERKKAENTILEANKKLVELSQIKSDLVMRVSHELKTPLSSIHGASQFLLVDFKDRFDSETLKLIEIIHRGCQKLKQLIENLLDVSRVESGKLDLELKEENLVELIKDCCDGLYPWAERRDINIKIELPDEIIVNVDKIRIGQVIINLISNAIKFTPPKGKIYIRLNENNQWADISIKDTGIGLTKREMKLIFQKFGKIVKNKDGTAIETDGSGLGLYISKEIVELHNGQILVKSEGRNKGSTFIVKLPRDK